MNEAPEDGDAVDTAELATPSVRVVITGGGVGNVEIIDDNVGVLGSCDRTCTIPVAAGTDVHVFAATPGVHGGLSGACTATGGVCEFTTTAGRSTVTATFGKAPGETFTKFFTDGDVRSAAFDGTGRLIIASRTQLAKLNASGGTVWQQPLAVCNLATGPGNTIYAQTTTSVVKLAASGAVLWTQPLDPHAVGCGRDDHFFDGFVHNIAVGPDGAVAIHGDTGVARWSTSGALTWSIELFTEDLHGVAIDPQGVVHVAADGDDGESLDLRRFAPDGSELARIEEVTSQKYGMLTIDPVGRLLVTASGHSHTDLASNLGTRSIHIPDFDNAPNGVAAAASDIAWLREDDDDSFEGRPWTLERIHADGSIAAFSSYVEFSNHIFETLGTRPHDIAGALDGRVALVGGFHNAFLDRGWVTVYGP